ncbi:hypothetical protein [Aerosakkonema funiforme]|uniref:Uncharacterized protein n=1 Tax=Aerosakkonema funiforme FACHB-1375 TaxID=2949571 RepID=A0A926VKU3_9CYAN|nr:hypothetical protein [Aerosakkonema funiforme]MBD2184274.1 hypothetical protein [Aerosakkonema funiforme FACHB-1375]
MTEIIYPTLDLFLYDLRNGAGDTHEEMEKNREVFLKKLPESVRPILFQFDSDFEAEYVELLVKPKHKRFVSNEEPYPVEGYYYPVRLGDTYGLLVDCSVNNQTDPQPAECFAALKADIEQKRLNNQVATIGQTWMISGQVPNADNYSIENLAKACYQALMPGLSWEQDLEDKGQFLGANIFELSRYRVKISESTTSATSIQDIQENLHVIIILYPHEDAARKGAKFYYDWIRLFYYRHKILWCYGQSRLLKQSLRKYLAIIQNSIKFYRKGNKRELNLKQISYQLELVQETLNPYSIELTYLDFQIHAIDINLGNYKKRLETIAKKAGADSELEFMQEFSALAENKYLLQITKDSDNLKLGLSLIDSAINTLRSRVEVDEAERDSIFQNAVAILGVGFGAITLFGDLPPEGVDDAVTHIVGNSLHVPEPWVQPTTTFVYNLGITILAGALTWLVIRFWPRSR